MRHSYEALAKAMPQKKQILVNGQACLIRGIQMEDGSGVNYNVTVLWRDSGKTETIFLRLY